MKATARTKDKRLPVRAGITGHRPNRMPLSEHERICRQLSEVMAKIEADHPGKHRLLTGLAEGADRLAANVALGRGWEIDAVLAFDRARFEQDFPEDHLVGEFRALLSCAKRVNISKPGRASTPQDAYEAVGRMIVSGSQLLIAIWDGDPSQGKGGTVDVIGMALGAGVSVVWINARKSVAPRWLTPGQKIPRAARSALKGVGIPL